MAQYYTLSNIFKHEDTTRHYCNSEGGFELLPPSLIDLAAQEPNFDTDYAEYVIFRRLHQIAAYIARQSIKKGYQINVTNNQNLKEDLENNNASKEYYEGWYQRYEDPTFGDLDPIFSVIDQAVRDNNWNFLYYLYYKEEEDLNDLLIKQKNRFNERKFFILQ